MKNKKGFTLVETITTLAILGIALSMSAVVLVNMTNTQRASSDQYRYSEEIREIFNSVDKYSSFISLAIPGEDGVSFTYSSVSEQKDRISFRYSEYFYDLYFNDGHLETVSNSGTGISSIDNFAINISIPDVTSFEFSYDTDQAILGINFVINGKENHGTFIVRTLA